MRDDKPTPVRLDDELRGRLQAAAERLGLSGKSAVIKLCLESFLDDFERRGTAALPLDWREIISARDGRRRSALIAAEANGHNNTIIVNHHAPPARYKIKRAQKKKKEA